MKCIGKTRMVSMTAEKCRSMLSQRKAERVPSNAHSGKIARVIRKYGWIASSVVSVAQPSGELLDGQHRLLALLDINDFPVSVPVCTYDDNDVNEDLRSSFNKSRPQSLRDTMRMVYGWDNFKKRVDVYSALYKGCFANQASAVDEYDMLEISAAVSDKINTMFASGGGSKKGPIALVRAAFMLAAITVDEDRVYSLYESLRDITFTSTTCHARRIYDFINDPVFKKLNGGGKFAFRAIVFAIVQYLKNIRCPDLKKVDVARVDEAVDPIVAIFRSKMR